MRDFISFVIPAYNEEAMIGGCVRSIKRAWPTAPIIVVDNGSTDNTHDEALTAGATVISQLSKGVTVARQTGLLYTNSEWVAFIDADNKLPRTWMLAFLIHAREPNVVGISGPPIFREFGKFKRAMVCAFYKVGAMFHPIMPMMQGGNFAVRRHAMIDAGGFPLDIAFYGEDTETAVRLSGVGKIIWEPGMWCWSSARRFKAEGFIFIGVKYMLNYFSIWLIGRPLHRNYTDHRPT